VTAGRIQFDTNGLGGRIARLHTTGGSYWYYAHLSGWNRDDFKSGDHVEPGDVIGYCGHSGDAKTTPNHLHFGWYTRDGKDVVAHNPMHVLVSWLKQANRKASSLVARAKRHESKTMGVQMLSRMFGESWAPDLSVVPAQEPSTAPPTPVSPTPSESEARCAPASPTAPETAPAPLADCIAPTVPLTATDGS
jgi:murein DD-endopeptidase MepM/ murein hydrolase activator NlpD